MEAHLRAKKMVKLWANNDCLIQNRGLFKWKYYRKYILKIRTKFYRFTYTLIKQNHSFDHGYFPGTANLRISIFSEMSCRCT